MISFKKKAMLAFVLSVSIGTVLAVQNTPQIRITEDSPLVETAFQIMLGKESNGQQLGGPDSVAGKNEPTTSKKGAIGIAQLMPDTAKYVAKKRGIKWNDHRYRYDAKYNRMLGLAYFKWQIRDFDGDLSKAFAAYNAGPSRTRKEIKKALQNGEDWLERMPSETRHYVTKNMNSFIKATQKSAAIKLSLNP